MNGSQLIGVIALGVLTIALAASCGPVGWMPGFRIGGDTTPPPASWTPQDLAHRSIGDIGCVLG